MLPAMAQPFFIVGTGRTGSTFLHALLRAHPRVVLSNEANLFEFLRLARVGAQTPAGHEGAAGPGIVSGEYSHSFSVLFMKHCRAILEEFYGQQSEGRDYSHWGDKLPRPESLSFIQELYPHARNLRLVRDPRDVICSARTFVKKLDRPPELAEESLEQLCQRMLYMHKVINNHVGEHLVVRYEDMVADPAATLAKALEYLGLPPDPACDAVLQEDLFSGHGTSASPKRSVGRFREDLSAEELAVVRRELADPKARWAYDLSD